MVCPSWRHWLGPIVSAIYLICLLVVLPLGVLDLIHKQAQVVTWFIAMIFMFLTLPISLWDIIHHIVNYTQPHLQRHIIRILWMVPIYSLDSWLALRFPSVSIYINTCRECYEAFVIYSFMAYLLSYLGEKFPHLESTLESRPTPRHLPPFCCCPPWMMGRVLLSRCKLGVLQYTLVRLVTTAIALVCESYNVYDEGNFAFNNAWSYIVVINNASQIIAMYCLILFYRTLREELAPLHPIGKFLCVKMVVFVSFWQAAFIAMLVKLHVISDKNTWGWSSVGAVAKGLQDFIICGEMAIAAVAHHLSFPYGPFLRQPGEVTEGCPDEHATQNEQSYLFSFLAMFDVRDVRVDMMEQARSLRQTIFNRRPNNLVPAPSPEEVEKAALLGGSRIGSEPSSPTASEGGHYHSLCQTPTTPEPNDQVPGMLDQCLPDYPS
uniref:transmembrane protein 184C isoform X2 n=1 Tax=Myxine glutinosa TaxID=7769 RepID=UPI00358F5748